MSDIWAAVVGVFAGGVLGLALGVRVSNEPSHPPGLPPTTIELSVQHVDTLLHDAKVCIARTDEILIQLYSLRLQRKP